MRQSLLLITIEENISKQEYPVSEFGHTDAQATSYCAEYQLYFAHTFCL
jgi:hypothetical protein